VEQSTRKAQADSGSEAAAGSKVGNLVMPPADASALPRIKSAKNAPGKRRNQTSNKWDNIHEYGGREAWINAESGDSRHEVGRTARSSLVSRWQEIFLVQSLP